MKVIPCIFQMPLQTYYHTCSEGRESQAAGLPGSPRQAAKCHRQLTFCLMYHPRKHSSRLLQPWLTKQTPRALAFEDNTFMCLCCYSLRRKLWANLLVLQSQLLLQALLERLRQAALKL